MVRGQLKAMIEAVERERRADLGKLLERAALEAKAKVTRVTRAVRTGVPADEVLAAAIGACPTCFGEDLLCDTCHGAGSPGSRSSARLWPSVR